MLEIPDVIFDFCQRENLRICYPVADNSKRIYMPPFVLFLLKVLIILCGFAIFSNLIKDFDKLFDIFARGGVGAVIIVPIWYAFKYILYGKTYWSKGHSGKIYVLRERILSVNNGTNFTPSSSWYLLVITVIIIVSFSAFRFSNNSFRQLSKVSKMSADLVYFTVCFLVASIPLYFNFYCVYEINFQTQKVYIDWGLFKREIFSLDDFGGIDRAYSSHERSMFFYRLWLKNDRYIKCIPISGLIESDDKRLDEIFSKTVIAKFESWAARKNYSFSVPLSENELNIQSDTIYVFSFFYVSSRKIKFKGIYIGNVSYNKFITSAKFDYSKIRSIEETISSVEGFLENLRQTLRNNFHVEYLDNRINVDAMTIQEQTPPDRRL